MRRSYHVSYWQHLQQVPGVKGDKLSLPQTWALGGSVVRTRTGAESQNGAAQCVIQFNQYNQKLAVKFDQIIRNTAALSPSIFDFRRWIFAGNNGLLLSPETNTCLIGDALGWGGDFVRWYTEKTYNAEWSTDKLEFSIDEGEIQVLDLDDLGLFLSSPGQDIYGHWLLDYVPRLYTLRETLLASSEITMTARPSWSSAFLEAFGVEAKLVPRTHPTQYLRAVKARLPGFLKSGYVLDIGTCRAAWGYLSKAIRERSKQSAGNRIRRIFVTRDKWNKTRQIQNFDALTALAVMRGYEIVAPETYSIADQASLFRDAEIVVGQDGSALHNIVFSEPGAVLGVISLPERCNLWHASICEAMGLRIAYCETSKDANGDYRLDVKVFTELLDAVEAAAARR
jgi:hypothetical protein